VYIAGSANGTLETLLFGVFAKLRQANFIFVVCTHPSAWNNSASTGGILIKYDS
jgi:hypothetical protein